MTQPALTVLDGVRWHGTEVVGARSQRLLARPDDGRAARRSTARLSPNCLTSPRR